MSNAEKRIGDNERTINRFCIDFLEWWLEFLRDSTFKEDRVRDTESEKKTWGKILHTKSIRRSTPYRFIEPEQECWRLGQLGLERGGAARGRQPLDGRRAARGLLFGVQVPLGPHQGPPPPASGDERGQKQAGNQKISKI